MAVSLALRHCNDTAHSRTQHLALARICLHIWLQKLAATHLPGCSITYIAIHMYSMLFLSLQALAALGCSDVNFLSSLCDEVSSSTTPMTPLHTAANTPLQLSLP